jgi:hypothetical protein
VTAASCTVAGRRRRICDTPATPWKRVIASGTLTPEQIRTVQARIAGINPDLTRQITHIQLRLTELSRGKTQALTSSRHLDLASLKPSIDRLQTTK